MEVVYLVPYKLPLQLTLFIWKSRSLVSHDGSWRLGRIWSERIKIDMAWRILDIVTSLHAVWTSYYNCKGLYLTMEWDSGHGTYVDSEEVIASVAGTVERVNKLVTVRAIRSRYNPEVGDLVVGRITEANSKIVLFFFQKKSKNRFTGTAPEMEGGCLFKAGCSSYVIFRQLARGSTGWECHF